MSINYLDKIKSGLNKAKSAAKTVFSGVSDKELEEMEKESTKYRRGGEIKGYMISYSDKKCKRVKHYRETESEANKLSKELLNEKDRDSAVFTEPLYHNGGAAGKDLWNFEKDFDIISKPEALKAFESGKKVCLLNMHNGKVFDVESKGSIETFENSPTLTLGVKKTEFNSGGGVNGRSVIDIILCRKK